MVLKKIREKRYIRKHIKVSLDLIEEEINRFTGKHPLAICPQHYENSWLGIVNATDRLFNNRVFKIRQYFSNPVYSKKELLIIAEFISRIESEHIVFSGYLPYFDILINYLSLNGKKVSVIYHGSHTSILEDSNAAHHFSSLLSMLKKGTLYHVGFVKKDLYKSLGILLKQKFYPILLKTNERLLSYNHIKFDGLNIGVLTHNQFRKNIYNMISAALLHDNAFVHVKDKYLADYLQNSNRIITHGYLSNENDFYKILGSVQLNMYVTFSECWGQIVNESLAMGVPCLCSDVSAVLDYDQELKEFLIVKEFDNDYAIYKKSIEVLRNLDYFKYKGPEYIRKLNMIADDYLNIFLD